MSDDAMIEQLADSVLAKGIEQGAADIRVRPEQRRAQIFYFIDGVKRP